jgi:hypothetical protein
MPEFSRPRNIGNPCKSGIFRYRRQRTGCRIVPESAFRNQMHDSPPKLMCNPKSMVCG